MFQPLLWYLDMLWMLGPRAVVCLMLRPLRPGLRVGMGVMLPRLMAVAGRKIVGHPATLLSRKRPTARSPEEALPLPRQRSIRPCWSTALLRKRHPSRP